MPSTPLYHLPGFYEPFSAISHLIGVAIFLVLGVRLLRRGRGSRSRLIYLGIYAFSCVFLLSMSSVYHMLERGGPANQVLARLDHGAIFVLIAGTFTPTYGILYHGWQRYVLLALIWVPTITAITLSTVFYTNLAEWLRLSFYLGLGWFGFISAYHLGRIYGWAFVRPLFWGGVAYSVGAVCEFLGWPILIPGVIHPHEAFHVAVLIGAWLHWRFVWQFANGHILVGYWR